MKSKMPYVAFTVADDEYKLKISANGAVDIEKYLGCSIIDATTKFDSITTQTAILHGALQKYHNGITRKQSAEIYEKYLDNGGSVIEFAEIILEIYYVSGFMKREQMEKAQEIMNTKA